MKKIYAVLGLVLSLGGSAFALEDMTKPAEALVLSEKIEMSGEEHVAQIRADFVQGKYNSLFDSLEADYSLLQESGRLQEFAEMRQVPEADEQMKGLARQFDKMAAMLIQERNNELKALLDGREEDLASRRIKSIAVSPEEPQQNAMRYLASLRFKTPDQASSPEERILIEIDLAHEFKSVYLDAHQANEADLLDKQIALGMEKMRKMQEAAAALHSDLKETVLLAAQGFDASQAKSLDMRDLIAAAKKPSSDLDRKIGAILAGFKAKKDDLYQKEFLAKLEL